MTAPRELIYGRHPVREALRAGRREVLEIQASERAVAAEPWLREAIGLRVHLRPDGALTAAAGTRDHQGVVAYCEPYRYADAWDLAAAERPLIVCLDGVTDPHNLGAICRSAEGSRATGVVVPERGAARVTAAVCRVSAGAVEHLSVAVVVNLSRYLNEVKRGDLWVWAAEQGASVSPSGLPTSRPERRSSSAPRARACGRRAPRLRRRARDPAGRSRRVAERERRVRHRPLRGGAAEAGRCLSRSSIVFDGYNLLHAGRIESRDELVDRLADFVALRGARGVVVFDGVGEDRRVGSLEVRFAENADGLIERVTAEARTQERVAVVSSDSAIRETAGPSVQRLSSRALRPGAGTRGVGARADVARLVPGRGRARPGDPRRCSRSCAVAESEPPARAVRAASRAVGAPAGARKLT